MKKIIFIIIASVAFVALSSVRAAEVFTKDLYYGIEKDSQATQLQEFLNEQGLYGGPITGNFYSLTLKAVKAFQQREGIVPAAGYFGPKTRQKANELIGQDITASTNQSVSETGQTPQPTQPAKTTTDVVSSLQSQIDLLLKQVGLLQQQLDTQQQTNTTIQNLQGQVAQQTQQVQQQTQIIQQQQNTLQQIQQNTAAAPTPAPQPSAYTPAPAPAPNPSSTPIQVSAQLTPWGMAPRWGGYDVIEGRSNGWSEESKKYLVLFRFNGPTDEGKPIVSTAVTMDGATIKQPRVYTNIEFNDVSLGKHDFTITVSDGARLGVVTGTIKVVDTPMGTITLDPYDFTKNPEISNSRIGVGNEPPWWWPEGFRLR